MAITRLSASVRGVIEGVGTPKAVNVQTVAVQGANTRAIAAKNAADFGIAIFRLVCVKSAGALDRILRRFQPSRRAGERLMFHTGSLVFVWPEKGVSLMSRWIKLIGIVLVRLMNENSRCSILFHLLVAGG